MQLVLNLLLVFTFCFTVCGTLDAQNPRKLAEKYYKEKDYQKALDQYNLIKNIQKDKTALAKRGICSYQINNLIGASKDLTTAYKMGNSHSELKYYMGRINHSMRKYEDAIFFYKSYLRELKASEEIRPDVAMAIKNCFSGIRADYGEDDMGLVENAGDIVNSKDDEINPVPSPSVVNRYYFSSNRAQDNYDLFSAEQLEGKWQQGYHIHASLNTENNELLQDCSLDGSVMVFLRGDASGSNRLYLNRFSESKHNQRVIFSETKAVSGDTDVYLVNDEIMIFASNREGGYGGYDLYMSSFSAKGWSKPQNLGPKINTSYNERYPFLNEAEDQLFFSSDNPNSIGGYDVFSIEKEGDEWTDIQSYNYPLNSPEDDIQFRIQEEGFQAYLASDRKTSSLGGYDIYTVYLRQGYEVHTSDPKQPLGLIRSSVKDEDYAYEEEEVLEKDPEKELVDEKAAADKLAAEQLEAERLAKEQLAAEKLAEEKAAADKLAAEQLEAERLAKEQLAAEKLAEEQAEYEIKEKEALDKATAERLAKEKEEKPTEVKPKSKSSRNKKSTVKSDVSTINLPAIIYRNDADVLSIDNIRIIDDVIAQMKNFNGSKIILTCHSIPEGLPEFELMFSIKRAEKIADYMVENGIERDRLILKGVGSSYPFVKELIDVTLNKEIEIYNNRIDIQMVNVSKNSVVQQPELDSKYLSTKYELYQTVTEDVYFRVFIHETDKKMYKNAILRYYNDLLIEHNLSKESYRYYVGLYTDFKTAFELKRELENRKIKEASIVAFYKGNILSTSDAKLLMGDFPELINFIEINQ